jgi:DNA-3-methyladenine glycosylase
VPSQRLPREALAGWSTELAPALLGARLVSTVGGEPVAVRLTELEAYMGEGDPGSHAFRGRTNRTAVMFGPAGHLYVYFTYGMHWCANVVCGRDGECEAVLLRAGEPVTGIDLMRARRGAVADRLLASGPARLAQSLGIDRAHNGASLLRGGDFWCAQDQRTAALRDGEVSQTTRIGLAAGRGDDIPWRFVVPGHPHASRRR